MQDAFTFGSPSDASDLTLVLHTLHTSCAIHLQNGTFQFLSCRHSYEIHATKAVLLRRNVVTMPSLRVRSLGIYFTSRYTNCSKYKNEWRFSTVRCYDTKRCFGLQPYQVTAFVQPADVDFSRNQASIRSRWRLLTSLVFLSIWSKRLFSLHDRRLYWDWWPKSTIQHKMDLAIWFNAK